jgi:HAAS domain-containing protein
MTCPPPGRKDGAAGSGPAPGAVIEAYLSAVATGLTGPARGRGQVIAELRSGLLDAADAHRRAGLAPAAAVQAAVAEFGSPGQIAAAFRPGLAAGQARRVAVVLLATGPLIGLLWAAAARASHVGIHAVAPWYWAHLPPAAPVALQLIAAVVPITVWTTLLTLATTGRLTRWLPPRPRLAPSAAAIAGFGAATADLILLAVLASQLAAPGTLAAGPVSLAAAASAARLILASRAGRRCLASRALLS